MTNKEAHKILTHFRSTDDVEAACQIGADCIFKYVKARKKAKRYKRMFLEYRAKLYEAQAELKKYKG